MTELIPLLTIIVCVFGIIITGLQTFFFAFSKNEFARRMRDLFATDCLLYMVTLGIGICLEFCEDNIQWIRIARIVVLVLNIWACTRLYNHYKLLTVEDDGKKG